MSGALPAANVTREELSESARRSTAPLPGSSPAAAISGRAAHAVRAAHVFIGWRHVLLDLAPGGAVVCAMLVVALLLPVLGGPLIELPAPASWLRHSFHEAWLWGAPSIVIALAVSRVRAVWRIARRAVPPVKPFPAASRTLLRLGHRAAVTMGAMLLLRLLMPVFVEYKDAIPQFRPFGRLDLVLGGIDRALHGTDPWRLLQPLVGRPQLTALIDLLYVRWYFVSITAFLVLTFILRGHRRPQFLLAFATAWVFLGIVLAAGLASVGPAFVDHLFEGESAYTPLLAYLEQVNQMHPLRALDLQSQLWQSYTTGAEGLVSGISAMPSMHVAMPALFAVASWHRSRLLAAGFWAYAAIILVGSVHLGWHYAVDGYASILLVFPLWWSAGVVAAWWYRRTRRWRWSWPDSGAEPLDEGARVPAAA